MLKMTPLFDAQITLKKITKGSKFQNFGSQFQFEI